MVIQVIMGDVGENGPFEVQSRNATLVDRMRTHFHKGIFAASFHHLGQQCVDGYGIGRCVGGSDHLAGNAIFYC